MADPVNTLQTLESEQATYDIDLGDMTYPLCNVRIYKTATPVRGSVDRGNVYTENHNSYRIEADIDQAAYGPLSRTMLGPSSRFGGLHVSAQTTTSQLSIEASLLNMSRSGGAVRLQMAVVGIE